MAEFVRRVKVIKPLNEEIFELSDRKAIAKCLETHMEKMEKKKMADNGKPKDMTDILVEFGGNRMVIPEGMDYDAAMLTLQKKKEQDETSVAVSEEVRAFPMDGAVAFAKVLKSRYGWTNLIPQDMGFFGRRPPKLIGVTVGHEQTIQVPWGSCTVPKIEGVLETSWTMDSIGIPIFRIAGEVKRKDEKHVAEIAAEVRETVRNESIYRGKAIKMSFRDGDGDRISDFGPSFCPQFINLDGIKASEIIYSDLTSTMLQVNLFNVVEHTAACRANGIPLKRGILLQGPFGTGKTLTADLLALKCVEHGWTFLYLEDVRDLDLALGFAEMYAPCVLFAEDVDKAVSGERTEEVNRLFNTMDGFESKNRDVMVVLTTNKPNTIHPGFLRPGRIDTVVHVTPPDENAVVRLVRLYGKDQQGNNLLEANDKDIAESLKSVLGINAAFVREIVERAKLAALSHSRDSLRIHASDLKDAAETMLPHIRMLYPDMAMQIDLASETETIDPFRAAVDFMSEHFAFHILNKLANPKVVEKIIVKKMAKKSRFRHGDPSAN